MVKDGEFVNSLTFANDGQFNGVNGSLIDIDTSREYKDDYFMNNIEKELNTAHESEKNLFFSLLRNSLLESLTPVYDE